MGTINPPKDTFNFIYNAETHAVLIYNIWPGGPDLQMSKRLKEALGEERAKGKANESELSGCSEYQFELERYHEGNDYDLSYPYDEEDKPLLAAMESTGESCPGMQCSMVPRDAVKFMKLSVDDEGIKSVCFKKEKFLNVSLETMLETQPVDAAMWKKLKEQAADIRVCTGIVVTVMPCGTNSQHMYVVFLDRQTLPLFSQGRVEEEYKQFISAFALEQMRALGHIDDERAWHVSGIHNDFEATVTFCHESRLGLDGLPELRRCQSPS